MTCTKAVALGAYVLGALDRAERHAVETHLRACERCRNELVFLAPIPGLLNRIPATDVPEPPPVPSPPRTRGRARRVVYVAVVFCLVVTGVAVGRLVPRDAQPSATPNIVVVSEAEGPGQVRATAALTPRSWGTEIRLRLRDLTVDDRCQLLVHGKDGSRDVTGSWTTASYPASVTVPAATSIDLSDITALEVRTTAGKQLVELPVSSPGRTTATVRSPS